MDEGGDMEEDGRKKSLNCTSLEFFSRKGSWERKERSKSKVGEKGKKKRKLDKKGCQELARKGKRRPRSKFGKK